MYDEFDIVCKPNPLEYWEIDATLKKERKAHRYPFSMLKAPGMVLTLLNVNERVARAAAYQYAKRHGWRITAIIEYEAGAPLWLTIRRVDGLVRP